VVGGSGGLGCFVSRRLGVAACRRQHVQRLQRRNLSAYVSIR
jgi:hypothetical protein